MCGAAVSVMHRRLGWHRRGAVSVFDDEVDWHFAFETTDVSMTEVVTQLMHLFASDHTQRASVIR